MIDRIFIAVLSASLAAFAAFTQMSKTMDDAERAAQKFEQAWRASEQRARDLQWRLDTILPCTDRLP